MCSFIPSPRQPVYTNHHASFYLFFYLYFSISLSLYLSIYSLTLQPYHTLLYFTIPCTLHPFPVSDTTPHPPSSQKATIARQFNHPVFSVLIFVRSVSSVRRRAQP